MGGSPDLCHHATMTASHTTTRSEDNSTDQRQSAVPTTGDWEAIARKQLGEDLRRQTEALSHRAYTLAQDIESGEEITPEDVEDVQRALNAFLRQISVVGVTADTNHEPVIDTPHSDE